MDKAWIFGVKFGSKSWFCYLLGDLGKQYQLSALGLGVCFVGICLCFCFVVPGIELRILCYWANALPLSYTLSPSQFYFETALPCCPGWPQI